MLTGVAFAAFHQLVSGNVVTSMVANDGTGNRADPVAITALVEAGLSGEQEDRLHLYAGW